MTTKFLENGGEIIVNPTTYYSGLHPNSYLFNTTNLESRPLNWTVESDYAKNSRTPQRLCPYNVYIIKVVERTHETPPTNHSETHLLDKESLSELLRIEDIMEERKFSSYIPLNA